MRTAILKEGFPAAIVLICGLIENIERRCRDEKASASRQATSGSIDAAD